MIFNILLLSFASPIKIAAQWKSNCFENMTKIYTIHWLVSHYDWLKEENDQINASVLPSIYFLANTERFRLMMLVKNELW